MVIGGRRGVVLAQRVVSGGGSSTGGHGSQREACLAYLPDFTATVYTPAADSGQLVGGGVTRVAGACGRGGEPVSGSGRSSASLRPNSSIGTMLVISFSLSSAPRPPRVRIARCCVKTLPVFRSTPRPDVTKT
ncbi:Uncharacterised protein [Mycobacteroides abscessus subsp. massiliense]|nr:Uncharacterised protein [Mycobacteroides abscessus subsp. massiliense]